MNAKVWSLLLVLALLAVPARAQESVRDLKGPGSHGAFLTPGQVDRWIFEGDKDETIIAHVISKEFDPVLELARSGTDKKDDDKVLITVDDPGNESRFAMRLPEKGQFKIRVHAYKYQGGGNYTLRVQRFQASPLAVGKPLVGAFDRAGRSHHFFQAAKDQILVPDLKGAASWKLLDFKGRELAPWGSSVLMEEGGEGHLVIAGPPDQRYDLVVRAARRREFADATELSAKLEQGELDVLDIQGKAGDFRVLEVEKKGELHARLIYAPIDKKNTQRIARPGDRPEIEFLPVSSRGGRLRFAAMLGRTGRYQLQLWAATPASYKALLRDPSTAVAWDKEALGNLPVGGAAFYSFQATPGQLIQVRLGSQKFVPALRMYDGHGSLVSSSGDDGDSLESRLTHMVLSEGLYRLQVGSLGDGGGGDYRLALQETKLKELQVGGRANSTVQPGATDFWTFPGKEGQTVILNVRSANFDPAVSLRSPDGVHLAADSKGGPATGSLLGVRLPRTGRYTVAVSSERGAGDYSVRLIDGD